MATPPARGLYWRLEDEVFTLQSTCIPHRNQGFRASNITHWVGDLDSLDAENIISSVPLESLKRYAGEELVEVDMIGMEGQSDERQ